MERLVFFLYNEIKGGICREEKAIIITEINIFILSACPYDHGLNWDFYSSD